MLHVLCHKHDFHYEENRLEKFFYEVSRIKALDLCDKFSGDFSFRHKFRTCTVNTGFSGTGSSEKLYHRDPLQLITTVLAEPSTDSKSSETISLSRKTICSVNLCTQTDKTVTAKCVSASWFF